MNGTQIINPIGGVISRIPNSANYQDCFVAYLDILGFKKFVEKEGNQAPERMLNFYRSFKFARALDYEFNLIEHRVFSDSIMLWCEHKNPHSLWNFFNQVELVRHELYEHNLLVRGGVSYGKHFSWEELVVSDALIEAHALEQKALFPRILIDPKILDLPDFKICHLGNDTYVVPYEHRSLIVNPGKFRGDSEGHLVMCPYWEKSQLVYLRTGHDRLRTPADSPFSDLEKQAIRQDGIDLLKKERAHINRLRELEEFKDLNISLKFNYLHREYNKFLRECLPLNPELAELMI